MTKLALYLQVIKAALLSGNNQEFYDRISSIYDDVFVTHRIHAESIASILEKFFPQKGHDVLVLDLGCGTGIMSKIMEDRGFHVIGMDISFESIERVQQGLDKIGLAQADAYSVPFADQSFQAVVCLGVWRHLLEPEEVLDEVVRVLNANGSFIVGYFPPALAGLYFLSGGFWGRMAVYFYHKVTQWLGYVDRIDFELEAQTLKSLKKRFNEVNTVTSGEHWHILHARFPVVGGEQVYR
jgi:ubiquinone/menaquinone biosynthesis C-methylase UbiE